MKPMTPKNGPARFKIVTCEDCGKDFPESSIDVIASENAGHAVCYACAENYI